MGTETWKWIILCVLMAAIYPFAHDLIIWLNWISAPIFWAKAAAASLALSVLGACAIYVLFAWLRSIPSEDHRQPK